MLRLLLFALGTAGVARLLKGLVAPADPPRPAPPHPGGPRAMVRDPICDVYIPVAKARALVDGGEKHYFCSTACQERFQRRAAS